MDSEKVQILLSLADSYEKQLINYNFYNDQLEKLLHTESEIKNLISSFIDNEELLLEMIKQHWSIIKFVKKDKDRAFFIKACTINPKCGNEARDLDLLIQLYKVNPIITKYAPPYYRDELAEYLKKNPQDLDEHISSKPNIIKVPSKAHISQMSIYDFLKLSMHIRRPYKLAGMITDKQVAFLIARGDLDEHWSMDSKLSQAMFPNRGYSMENVYTGGIGVFGVGYNIFIDIPNKVSPRQFQALSDIINQAKQFEVDYDVKIEDFNPEAILKEAQAKLSTSYSIESDEVIVGTPLDANYLKDIAKQESTSLEGCDDLSVESETKKPEDFDKEYQTARIYHEEKAKDYEQASMSNELMEQFRPKSKEEIDADLDDFETEERKILNSKHFTDAQKKLMIEELYSEFDKYAEENPELSGKHL